MIDPAKLAAFALVTGLTSLTPGPSMLFIMSQAVWRGTRSGLAAMAGMQAGFLVWWLMAALGLGSVMQAWPNAFRAMAVGGALSLAWIGIAAWRHAGEQSGGSDQGAAKRRRAVSHHAFRDGVLVAIGNPKSLVYMAALLPPFLDARQAVAPQVVVLATVAMAIDVAIGGVYIAAGSRLAAAMDRPHVRRTLDRAVGLTFMLIALGVCVDVALRARG